MASENEDYGIRQRHAIFYYDEFNPQSKSCLIAIKLLEYNVVVMNVTGCPECRLMPILMSSDTTLSDGHATLLYLCETSNRSCAEMLFPRDLNTRYQIMNMLFFESTVLEPLVKQTDGMGNSATKTWSAYDTLETLIAEKPFIMGDTPTLADISLITAVLELNVCWPVEYWRWCNLYSWILRMLTIPAVCAVFTEPTPNWPPPQFATSCCTCQNFSSGGYPETSRNPKIEPDIAGCCCKKAKPTVISCCMLSPQQQEIVPPSGTVTPCTSKETKTKECECKKVSKVKQKPSYISISSHSHQDVLVQDKETSCCCIYSSSKPGKPASKETSYCCNCDISQIQGVVEQLRCLGKKDVTLTIKFQMSNSCVCQTEECNLTDLCPALSAKISNTSYTQHRISQREDCCKKKPEKQNQNEESKKDLHHYHRMSHEKTDKAPSSLCGRSCGSQGRTAKASNKSLCKQNLSKCCCSEKACKDRYNHHRTNNEKIHEKMNKAPKTTCVSPAKVSNTSLSKKNHNNECCCSKRSDKDLLSYHRKSHEKMDKASRTMCGRACGSPGPTAKVSNRSLSKKNNSNGCCCSKRSDKDLLSYHRKSHEKMDKAPRTMCGRACGSPGPTAKVSNRSLSKKNNSNGCCCSKRSDKDLLSYHRKSHEKMDKAPRTMCGRACGSPGPTAKVSNTSLSKKNNSNGCCCSKRSDKDLLSYHRKSHEKMDKAPRTMCGRACGSPGPTAKVSNTSLSKKNNSNGCCCSKRSDKDLLSYHRKSHEKMDKAPRTMCGRACGSPGPTAKVSNTSLSKKNNSNGCCCSKRSDKDLLSYHRKSHEKMDKAPRIMCGRACGSSGPTAKVSNTSLSKKNNSNGCCCSKRSDKDLLSYHRKSHENMDKAPRTMCGRACGSPGPTAKVSNTSLSKKNNSNGCCCSKRSDKDLLSYHRKSHKKMDKAPRSMCGRPCGRPGPTAKVSNRSLSKKNNNNGCCCSKSHEKMHKTPRTMSVRACGSQGPSAKVSNKSCCNKVSRVSFGSKVTCGKQDNNIRSVGGSSLNVSNDTLSLRSTASRKSKKKVTRAEECHKKSVEKPDDTPWPIGGISELTDHVPNRSLSSSSSQNYTIMVIHSTEFGISQEKVTHTEDYCKKCCEKQDKTKAPICKALELTANTSISCLRSGLSKKKQNVRSHSKESKKSQKKKNRKKSPKKQDKTPRSIGGSSEPTANMSYMSSSSSLNIKNDTLSLHSTESRKSQKKMEHMEVDHKNSQERQSMTYIAVSNVLTALQLSKISLSTGSNKSPKKMEGTEDSQEKSHDKLDIILSPRSMTSRAKPPISPKPRRSWCAKDLQSREAKE